MLLRYDGITLQTVDVLAGDILGHTQTSDGNARAGELAIRFTNPFAGTATISGSVWDAHTTVNRRQQCELRLSRFASDNGGVLGMTFDDDLTPTSVMPAPASLPLSVAGIGGLLLAMRRRR